MSILGPEQFDTFFEALHHHAPFRWQRRLLEHVVSTGTWPEVIDAPTGAGKSSVIDVHVFANAIWASHASPRRGPRRLAITVDRRALVDGHAEHARRIADTLSLALEETAPSILTATARALAQMRAFSGSAGEPSAPFDVATLRGGLPASRDWLDDPAACQVIAATPDMWGSRVLFRGYGSSRWAQPRAAGLLSLDSVLVLDEAHLNRQLLTTARRVADLVEPQAGALGVPGLQVTAMTATPADDASSVIGVDPTDLVGEGADRLLAARLERPKPLRVREVPYASTAATTARMADVVVEEVLAMLSATSGTVGCVVNTVRLAVAVASRLEKARLAADTSRTRAGQRPAVVSVVGRMRPYDITQIRLRHAGLFTHDGDPEVDVVVATQTIEVGVDMDFAGMVTELAAGSAMAQRAGRVNRSGHRDTAPVVVIAPEDPAALQKAVGPYTTGDLEQALVWLGRRQDDAAGLAPWRIHPASGGDAPSPAAPRRPVWHRVERWNLDLWARTSESLFAEPELDLWLSDDLETEMTAGLVVRAGLPSDAAGARAQVRAAPPLAHEVFPVRLGELRDVVDGLRDVFDDGTPRYLVLRGDDIAPAGTTRLRPEDIVVVDAGTRTFTSGVVVTGGEDTMPDVTERAATAIAPTRRTVRIGHGAPALVGARGGDQLLADLLRRVTAGDGADDDSDLESDLGSLLRGWLTSQDPEQGPPGSDEARRLLGTLLESDRFEIVVGLPPEGLDGGFWLVAAGQDSTALDDDMRQVQNARRAAVDLDEHGRAVAEAAARLASRLGLEPQIAEPLVEASRLHDEGKSDPRFQRSLRASSAAHPERLLAKSGMRSVQLIRRARAASQLPAGWRHEQLSAAIAWSLLASEPPEDRDLVVRLVGTSHGHGRGSFDHTALELEPTAREGSTVLFDAAEWDVLVERTTAHWGHWGIAYLEALLRAADVTTSRRGS